MWNKPFYQFLFIPRFADCSEMAVCKRNACFVSLFDSVHATLFEEPTKEKKKTECTLSVYARSFPLWLASSFGYWASFAWVTISFRILDFGEFR